MQQNQECLAHMEEILREMKFMLDTGGDGDYTMQNTFEGMNTMTACFKQLTFLVIMAIPMRETHR